MSAASETLGPARKVRPFYWSVRRELFENPALYLAPLAVEGVVLLAFFFASFSLPGQVAKAAAGGKVSHITMPYPAAAAAAFLAAFLVAIFYSLGALHGDRRDRSILFWKSLPVSDLTTVLSKAAIPLVVQSVIVLGVVAATHLIMLAWATLILLVNGVDPHLYWSQLKLPLMWTFLSYGLVVNFLWDVPFYGWLLLVSAWAKRMTFVWAVAPWLGLALFEWLTFRSKHVLLLLQSRIFGGFSQGFTGLGDGTKPFARHDLRIDPGHFLAKPELWMGLVVGIAFLAACVWLRRRQEPI